MVLGLWAIKVLKEYVLFDFRSRFGFNRMCIGLIELSSYIVVSGLVDSLLAQNTFNGTLIGISYFTWLH